MQPAVSGSGPKKKFNAAYIVIPILILGVIGVGVAWEGFRAKMEAAQQGQGGEQRLGVADGPNGTVRERKSRELKVVKAALPPPVVEEEELTALGKKKKPPPPKVYPPAERAWRSLKADYDKLEGRNETTAKKYRIKILAMEDRKDSTPEAAFVKEAAVLEEALRTELAKPENQ